nr:MAG TPA: hypothetical protein [Caudoviricetes sp.]
MEQIIGSFSERMALFTTSRNQARFHTTLLMKEM